MTENECLIIELEKRLLQPEVRSSKEDVAQLLDDDFEEFGKSGRRLRKDDVLKGLSEEEPVTFTMDRSNVVALSDDVMLITYSLIKDDCQSKSHRSSIWRCKNGKWKLFFHQGTKANSTS